MARFLLTVWPFDTHVHTNIALAHALHKRGHEVAFYTGPTARSIVESEGFRCFPFQKVNEARVRGIVESIISGRIRPWHQRALWREFLLETVPSQVADLEILLAAWPTDVVICDPAMWGPILVLHETRHIPVAVFSHVASCMVGGRDGPILGVSLPRPRNWHARLRARLVQGIVNRFTADIRQGASVLRHAYGLSPLRTTVVQFAGGMPLYLVPSTAEFDYERHDLPPSVHYVGPCLWDKAEDEPGTAWLDRIRHDQPWVLVTEGTLHVQEPFVLRAAAQGLANLPIQVIMMTGRHRDPKQLDLGTMAPNVHVERWVSLREVLHRTAIVITTGDSDNVLAALNEGVPLVVVPTIWDQSENAWRVVEAGAGMRLKPRQCTPDRLRAAVERVLGEASFRRNARRLATVSRRYGGPARAAELLEGLLIGRPVHPITG